MNTPPPPRIVVYTALFGNYDTFNVRANPQPGIDYLCFTDDTHLDTSYYERRLLALDGYPSPHTKSRIVKIRGPEFLQEYDISIYHDANMGFAPEVDIFELINRFLGQSHYWAMFRHPSSTTVFEEATAICQHGKGSSATLAYTLLRLKLAGYPLKTQGVSAGGILLRDHRDQRANDLSEAWWALYNRFPCKRDQMYFDIAKSSGHHKIVYLDGQYRNNPYFDTYITHSGTHGRVKRKVFSRLPFLKKVSSRFVYYLFRILSKILMS